MAGVMAPENNMLKIIFVAVVVIVSFLIGGSFGYHLADQRIGQFIQSNAIDNAVFHYRKVSEVIQNIEEGDSALAIQKLESLKNAETVLFQSCLSEGCPDELRQKIGAVYKP